jgi:hypothetical protein
MIEDYDEHRDPVIGEPYCRGCRWILAGFTALGILGFCRLVWGQEAQPEPATVYVHVCDADQKCKTITFPAAACVAGGQALFASLLAESGWTVRAFHCEVGEQA